MAHRPRRTVKEAFTDPSILNPLKEEFATFANKVLSGAVESGVNQIRRRMKAAFKDVDSKLGRVQDMASSARDDEEDSEGRQH